MFKFDYLATLLAVMVVFMVIYFVVAAYFPAEIANAQAVLAPLQDALEVIVTPTP